jgi:transcriptional regulator with XRE-family HTH domain
MKGTNMGVRNNLTELRKASGLSQDDVARAVGISRPAYKQIETGVREPSMTEINSLSELLGVRVEDLTSTSPLRKTILASTNWDGIEQGVDKIKYKNLMLYLASRVGASPNVGETVFYKLIYFIETLAYLRFGKTITGERFRKLQYGPVPASFIAITEEMINSGELDKVKGRYFTYMQTKYLPRVEATGLTPDEKSIIDTVINKLGTESATSLSNLSHEDEPWLSAGDNEYVDLSLIFQTEPDVAQRMGR